MPRADSLDARLPAAEAILREALAAGTATCAVLEIGDADGVRGRAALGRLSAAADAPPAGADTIFDLASLTKVLGTTLLAMRLDDAGRCATTDRVGRWWPAWYGPGRDETTIADLLAHASGLAAHRPLYRGPARRPGVRRRDLPAAARGAAAHRGRLQRSRLHPARRGPRARRRRRPRRPGRADVARPHRRARSPIARRRRGVRERRRRASTRWRQRELIGEVHDAQHVGDGWRGRARRALRLGAGRRRHRPRRVARAARDACRRPRLPRHRAPVRDAAQRRAGHDARARLGHDAGHVVVRALHERRRRSATPASPARRCGSTTRATPMSCC